MIFSIFLIFFILCFPTFRTKNLNIITLIYKKILIVNAISCYIYTYYINFFREFLFQKSFFNFNPVFIGFFSNMNIFCDLLLIDFSQFKKFLLELWIKLWRISLYLLKITIILDFYSFFLTFYFKIYFSRFSTIWFLGKKKILALVFSKQV